MAQLVEHNLAKVGVAGSSPVVRSIWAFSSGGERFPDTEEVRSSNLLTPTKCSQPRGLASGLFFLEAIIVYVARIRVWLQSEFFYPLLGESARRVCSMLVC